MDTVITVSSPEEEQLAAAAAAAVSAAAPAPAPPDPLAEENARLREELQRLKSEQKRREVAALLSELRASGQLTPAMEYAGIEEALVSAEEQGVMVSLPSGQRLSFAAVLKDVLAAIPCSYVSGCVCGDAPATGGTPQLSADELSVAQSLGLTPQEYAEIRG
ncbi:hypothetical protein IT575_01215 [bacterium]|nr:hypothetical protein [bacterium]